MPNFLEGAYLTENGGLIFLFEVIHCCRKPLHLKKQQKWQDQRKKHWLQEGKKWHTKFCVSLAEGRVHKIHQLYVLVRWYFSSWEKHLSGQNTLSSTPFSLISQFLGARKKVFYEKNASAFWIITQALSFCYSSNEDMLPWSQVGTGFFNEIWFPPRQAGANIVYVNLAPENEVSEIFLPLHT